MLGSGSPIELCAVNHCAYLDPILPHFAVRVHGEPANQSIKLFGMLHPYIYRA